VGQKSRTKKRCGCCAGLSKDASGQCAAAAPATCTNLHPINTSSTQGLQEAIDQAADGATLTLCPGSWHLSATLVIDKNLTLIGAGAGQTVLDGGRPPSGPGGVRVLEIPRNLTVTVQDLTITKGHAADDDGGGISNTGTLTLRGVAVTDNTATSFGGGIFSDVGGRTGHTMTLENSSVTGNSAGGGGGIFNGRSLTLEPGSRMTGNTAGSKGGGIFNRAFATATLKSNSRVTGNTAATGGGIFNDSVTDVGTGTVFPGFVTLEPGAIVCDNSDPQCDGGGTYDGPGICPSHSDATCPA
jgi:hypothetical protein